jgi:alkylation response protein AidB-like acyl-CoA dehydrogenase
MLREWNRTLADAGWAAPAWPRQWGGREASIPEQLAWQEEMARFHAPGPVNVIGVANIAPAIMAFGTDEMKESFLIPMLRGDEIWSQGMSEPNAGSDLASLQTRAVLDGDDFIINGQKIWNSLGTHADRCQLYVRTDPDAPKHKGISCLLVDLNTPGIEVRGLRTMTGEIPFAEIFFTDVRVPASRLLGELNKGWYVAMTTLSYERAGVARMHLGLSDTLNELLTDARAKGRPELNDPIYRQRIAEIHSKIAAMRSTTDREFAALGAGKEPSASLGATAKLLWSQTSQSLAELAVDIMGIGALDDEWGHRLLGAQSNTIAGGTTNVNKNILAEHGLGLPR